MNASAFDLMLIFSAGIETVFVVTDNNSLVLDHYTTDATIEQDRS